MNDGLVRKLQNKWYLFVWDYLINNKSSILFQECSNELGDVHNKYNKKW